MKIFIHTNKPCFYSTIADSSVLCKQFRRFELAINFVHLPEKIAEKSPSMGTGQQILKALSRVCPALSLSNAHAKCRYCVNVTMAKDDANIINTYNRGRFNNDIRTHILASRNLSEVCTDCTSRLLACLVCVINCFE